MVLVQHTTFCDAMNRIKQIVYCLFALTLQASALTLSLDKTTYEPSSAITASWTQGSGNGKDWVAIYPDGVTPGNQPSEGWLYIGGTQTSKKKGPKNGSVTFASINLPVGAYSMYYLSNDTYTVLAGPINFTVAQAGGETPTITTNKANYEVNETITVQFSNGPANDADWIGFYYPGQIPAQGTPASLWTYTNGTTTSGNGTTSGSIDFVNPGFQPGNYEIYFLEDNGYTILSGPVAFTVVASPGPAVPQWIKSPFKRIHGVVGATYQGKISAYASDADIGDTLSFSLVSGPSWLNLASDGTLSGIPANGDIGNNQFIVKATDLGGNNSTATMNIEVFANGAESVPELKVLSFNLWHGLGQINYGHRKGIEAIILSGADIIGTQETVDNVSGTNAYQAQVIADALGWHYSPAGSGNSGIISRYPIVSQFTAGIANGIRAKLTSSPVKEVIFYNCHLDYLYYGPYKAQEPNSNAQKVLTEEKKSQRDEQIAAIISAMTSDLNNAENVPVFLTGDFNAPSHLDWTSATSATHGGVGYVAWPTSLACVNAGLLDSYRMIHPDPFTDPANTWSPLFIGGGEAQDRIDFIYYKGSDLTPTASEVFTTAVETTLGAWGSSITPALNNTWPSDHAAVLTTFSVAP